MGLYIEWACNIALVTIGLSVLLAVVVEIVLNNIEK